jgi:hypothetical protein
MSQSHIAVTVGLSSPPLMAPLRPLLSSSAHAEDPVRRGFSILSLASLEYWIAAFAAMTVEYVAAISRRIAPEVLQIVSPSPIQRAQGMPDARCTRGLMRNVHKKCAHEHTGQRRTSDIPCAMALRLITRSPR